MSLYVGHDHAVTVTTHPYRHYDADSKTWIDEVDIDREIEHPAACDALKYGVLCELDQWNCDTGSDDMPAEPGKYLVRVWSSGPDYEGEYDGGLTVEAVEPAPVDGAS